MLPIVIKILLVIHVLVSLLIILLVLMQRPKNEGLGAAFGGGATDQLFGAQTTNVLQLITRWLGGLFFGLTMLLSILYVKQGGGRSPIQEKLTAPTVIPAPPTPPPAADGKEPVLELPAPGKAEEAVTLPVQAPQSAPGAEKMPEKPAPAPGAETPAAPVPPVPPPAENKPAENKSDAPAPAPEPKPAEPAK